jgi:competence protein ComEA
MALVDIQPSARERAAPGTKKVASLAPRGGGRAATPAARGIPAAWTRAVRGNVWAPLVLKAFGVLAGMLALAAIGASSIARGSGIPVTAASAGTAPLSAAGVTESAPARDAGAARIGADAGRDVGEGDGGTTSGVTADGKIVLNRASADELRRIPGVGPKRAEAIVALRAKLGGRFKRLGDLLRIKGIGVKSLKKMEAYVVLDAPPA